MLRALTSRISADICDENVLLTSSNLARRIEYPPIKGYRICEVEIVDGSALTVRVPRYQVQSANSKCITGNPYIKVIDFERKKCARYP